MKKYDALVIGSGAEGTFAAKELSEQGLLLMLEAGANISEDNFINPEHEEQKGINLKTRGLAATKARHIQTRIGIVCDLFKHLFGIDLTRQRC